MRWSAGVVGRTLVTQLPSLSFFLISVLSRYNFAEKSLESRTTGPEPVVTMGVGGTSATTVIGAARELYQYTSSCWPTGSSG